MIGTLARKAAEASHPVYVVSSDKDMMQLVNDKVQILNPPKDNLICDAAKAHLFYTSNDGHMWRRETALADFPHGWSEPQLALQGDIFEGGFQLAAADVLAADLELDLHTEFSRAE